MDLRTTLQCVQGNNPRSISFMIKTNAMGCSHILSTGSNVKHQMFAIGFSCNVYTRNIIQTYGAELLPNVGKVINDGLWHTVLVSYDETLLSIFVDGVLDNSASTFNGVSIAATLETTGNSANYLGQGLDLPLNRWVGHLKNVIFYDYVVPNAFALANSYQTAGEVLYNSGYNI